MGSSLVVGSKNKRSGTRRDNGNSLRSRDMVDRYVMLMLKSVHMTNLSCPTTCCLRYIGHELLAAGQPLHRLTWLRARSVQNTQVNQIYNPVFYMVQTWIHIFLNRRQG